MAPHNVEKGFILKWIGMEELLGDQRFVDRISYGVCNTPEWTIASPRRMGVLSARPVQIGKKYDQASASNGNHWCRCRCGG